MEKLTVDKDFVLRAHNAACEEWKVEIEKQFPQVFSKYERGDVFIHRHGGEWVLFITPDFMAGLVCISDVLNRGEVYSGTIVVRHCMEITREEFERIDTNKVFKKKQ